MRRRSFSRLHGHLPPPRSSVDDLLISQVTDGEVTSAISSRPRSSRVQRILPLAVVIVAVAGAVRLLPSAGATGEVTNDPPQPAQAQPLPRPSIAALPSLPRREPVRTPRDRDGRNARTSKVRVAVAAPSSVTRRVTTHAAPATSAGATERSTQRAPARPEPKTFTVHANTPLIHLRHPQNHDHWYTTKSTAATYKETAESYRRVGIEGSLYDERVPGSKPFRTAQGFMGFIGVKLVQGSFPLWKLTHPEYGEMYSSNISHVNQARYRDNWRFEGVVGYLYDSGRPAEVRD